MNCQFPIGRHLETPKNKKPAEYLELVRTYRSRGAQVSWEILAGLGPLVGIQALAAIAIISVKAGEGPGGTWGSCSLGTLEPWRLGGEDFRGSLQRRAIPLEK